MSFANKMVLVLSQTVKQANGKKNKHVEVGYRFHSLNLRILASLAKHKQYMTQTMLRSVR